MKHTGIYSGVILLAAISGGGCTIPNDVARLDGYTALRNGDFAEARERFEYCIDRDPTDWKSHYYLGRIGLDAMEDPYYARRHLELAETIRKSLPDHQLAPRPGAAQTAVPYPTRHEIADALAEAMLRQGLQARLYHYTRQQVQDYGETEDYLRTGRYLAAMGDRDAAELALVKATMIADAADPRPHLLLADFYDKAGDRASALVELRKAYYIDPSIDGLADNIRAHGMVPGPTVGIPPEREKPTIIRRGAEEPRPTRYPSQPDAAQPTNP